MVRKIVVGSSLAWLMMLGRAEAQEAPVPPAAPAVEEPVAEEPVAEEPVAEEPVAEQPAPPPEEAQPEATVPTADSPELVQTFDRAIELLIQGRFSEAATLFDQVAAQSVESERRAAAAELARQSVKRMGIRPSDSSISSQEQEDRKRGAAAKDDGRAQFLTSTIVVGLNYGWMLPYSLGIDDGRAFVGLYLLTAGSSFVVPYLVTKEQKITRGMATLGGSGALLGAGHGALLYGALAGADGFDDIDNSRALVATMLMGSVLEGTSAYWWAKRENTSAARSLSMTWGSLWGTGIMGLANLMIFEDDIDDQVTFGSMLGGAMAGAYGGYVYDRGRKPTEGDVQIVSYSGLLGAYTVLAPLVVAEVDDARIMSGGLIAGSIGGLILGDHLLEGRDYTRGQGGVVILGSLAGGLLGGGLAFLVTPESTDLEKTLTPGSALGALLGYGLMRMAIPGSKEGSDDDAVADMGLSPILGENGERGMAISGSF